MTEQADPPPIWIVNLPSAVDRREFLREQLQRLGLKHEFVPAVDGHSLGPAQRRRYSSWRAWLELGRTLTPGEVGCALSHFALYERLLASPYEEVLILEDDILCGPELLGLLRARSRLPVNWEVIALRHPAFARLTPLPVPPIINDAVCCAIDGGMFGTCAYLIRPAGAHKLLRGSQPFYMPIDSFMYGLRNSGLAVYAISPSVIRHATTQFKSQIPDRRRTSIGRRGLALAARSLRGARRVWRSRPFRIAK